MSTGDTVVDTFLHAEGECGAAGPAASGAALASRGAATLADVLAPDPSSDAREAVSESVLRMALQVSASGKGRAATGCRRTAHGNSARSLVVQKSQTRNTSAR